MTKKLFNLVFFFLASIPAFGQIADTAWVRRYNGPGNYYDIASAIAVDDSGNVYVTGSSSDIGSLDYATIKYYPNGDTAWVRRYNGPGDMDDCAYALAVDSSGNVYVTGYSWYDETSDDYTTIKYYSNGDTAWVRRYNGPANDIDYAKAIGVDGSGNVYVTGWSFGSGTDNDYATIKYFPNGDTAWVRRYNGPGNLYDAAYAIVVDSSGNAYVTGGSIDSATAEDFATIKYIQFLRSDPNDDGQVSIGDVIFLVNYLFRGGPASDPLQSGDVNCNGQVSIGDIIYLINYLFRGGPPPQC